MPREVRLRFSRLRRVRRRREYVSIYGGGLRVAGELLVVFARPRSNGEDGCRLGVTASRRVGSAVVRNRCKRRIREVFRTLPEEHDGMRADLVINARDGCAAAEWCELIRDYRRCMRRLRAKLASTEPHREG